MTDFTEFAFNALQKDSFVCRAAVKHYPRIYMISFHLSPRY